MFFENISEEAGPLNSGEDKILGQVNNITGSFFWKKPDRDGCKKLAEELLNLRKEITDRMQVLSAYVDCFSVYEYILNNLEYRFKEMGEMPEDVKFTEDVVQFIFSSKDNAAINEKVRFVIGQLPMRMLRSKYFDVIRESVSIYKGNSLSSLEGFEYMFRTNAMLYKDKNMDIYFTEFKKPLEELKNAGFEDIDNEQYKTYNGIVEDSTYELLKLSDLYILFGDIVNLLYTIVSVAAYTEEADRVQDRTLDVAATIIQCINILFSCLNNDAFKKSCADNDIWKRSGEELGSMEEKIGKITLDDRHYPGEDFYCDGAVEDELLEIVKKYDSGQFRRIIEERAKWPVLYHLSPLRENIVDWLPMDKSTKVLEIGSGCGAITGKLAGKAGSVTCVEL